jgi:hypothetical protein
VTVRNNTDRAVALDPARLELVDAAGQGRRSLTGAALESALATGPPADRVRAELLDRRRIPARSTLQGYLVFPPAVYREARITIEDVETGEGEGFVAPVR